MEKFSMPNQVSATLELDEIMRLKQSLETTISKEEAEKIMSELSLPINSSPDVRAEWVDKLSTLLESRFDENKIKAIREKCYCNENGRLEETAEFLRDLYKSFNKDLHSFVNALNENGACWYIKDNQLYTKMFSCECPMLEKAKNTHSLTWCHCTAGYNKKLFEIVFETPIDVEIMHSIRQGFDFCLLRVTFK
ncbi:hypothetical protein IMSAG049_00998 [Clostridiales bacterium]|nr:hypothetical protein IMSAG049_00998 [Clostridiales bacterium]